MRFFGCYTNIQRSQNSSGSNESPATSSGESQPLTSIVEGIVEVHGGANTAETHYHPGFILTQFSWVTNPPQYSASVMYLVGSVDNSYLHKRVRVEGTYQLPSREPRAPGSAPDYTSEMYLRIENIQIIN